MEDVGDDFSDGLFVVYEDFLLNCSLHEFGLPTTRPPDAYANQQHFCFSHPISDTFQEMRDF